MTPTSISPPFSLEIVQCLALLRDLEGEPITASGLLLSVIAQESDLRTGLLAALGNPAVGMRQHSANELRGGHRRLDALLGLGEITVTEELQSGLVESLRVAQALRAPVVSTRHVLVALLLDDASSIHRELVGTSGDALEDAVASLVSTDVNWLRHQVAAIESKTSTEFESPAGDALGTDPDPVVNAVDTVVNRRMPWPALLGRAFVLTAFLAFVVGLVGIMEFNWQPPWIRDLRDIPGAWVRQAASLSKRGDHIGAAKSYKRALDLSPDRLAAIDGRTCELWALGYRDAAVIDLEQALNLPGSQPDAGSAWPSNCALRPELRRQLRVIKAVDRFLVVVPSANDAWRQLRNEYKQGPAAASTSLAYLYAGCMNTQSGYDWLASRQLNEGLRGPNALHTFGALHNCLANLVPVRYGRVRDPSGNGTILQARDLASRQYVDGHSPVPPPTTLPLPAG